MLILLHQVISPLPNGPVHANRSVGAVRETAGEIGVYSERIHQAHWSATTDHISRHIPQPSGTLIEFSLRKQVGSLGLTGVRVPEK